MSSIAVLMLTTVLQGASTCKCCGSTQVKAGGGKTCGKEHSWTRAGGCIDCQTVDRGPGCMLAGSNPEQRQSFSLQVATVADQGGGPSTGGMLCVCQGSRPHLLICDGRQHQGWQVFREKSVLIRAGVPPDPAVHLQATGG